MTERYNERGKATTAFVLLSFLGGVSTTGYLVGERAISYGSDQLGNDWRQFSREAGIANDDAYTNMTSKIGSAATQCFMKSGAGGISMVDSINGSDKFIVIYRLKGNETVDPKVAEECIYKLSGEQDVVVSPSIHRPDGTQFTWEVAQQNTKDVYEKIVSRILNK